MPSCIVSMSSECLMQTKADSLISRSLVWLYAILAIFWLYVILVIVATSAGTPEEKFRSAFRMYDVDGNAVIDQDEMANVMQAIYGMMGEGAKNPGYWADESAKCIFIQMDENSDGHITEDEFLRGCLQDDEL